MSDDEIELLDEDYTERNEQRATIAEQARRIEELGLERDGLRALAEAQVAEAYRRGLRDGSGLYPGAGR